MSEILGARARFAVVGVYLASDSGVFGVMMVATEDWVLLRGLEVTLIGAMRSL